MKNKIKWYPVIVVLCIACVHCSKYDDYKKYMPDGEIIYPQKADSVKTYPGKNRIQLEWVIVDPKVTSCKIFYEQGGVQESTTVAISAHSDYFNDTIRIIIPNLEETTYAFKIVSYDDFGHSSVTVEAEESAYGEVYEDALVNRTLKSKVYDINKGLNLEWFGADDTEIAVKLSYTDINGNNRTMFVADSVTTTSIPDFKVSEPLFYSTMYKPVPAAIDTFYAQVIEEKIPYYADITSMLKNTGDPFIKGDMVHDNRFYVAADWIANAAAAANGNVDNLKGGGCLTMWAWGGYSPSTNFVNGKLYQTVELEAGTYRFDAFVFSTSNAVNKAYVVAALGNNLPDIDNVSQALASVLVPAGIAEGAASKPTLSVEFTITEKTNVSLGFLANINSTQETVFRKVELWEKR